MYHGAHDGWVEVVSGVMFSGKSEELMRRVRRALIAKRKVQVFKSHLDDRYGGVGRLSTHDGAQLEAQPITSSVQIAAAVRPDTQVVGIDEAQFLDDGIVAVCVRGHDRQRLDLLNLPLPTPPPEGAEWIDAYRYWAGR